MADPQHVEWLKEGVAAWNERRRANDFRPDLRGMDLKGANLVEADLKMTDLREANLQEVSLGGADLTEAQLSRAKLEKADLEQANLGRADLAQADLRKALLIGADLERADLEGARLVQANFLSANLSGANLRKADLEGAFLVEAKLKGAKLGGANLLGTNFVGADVRSLGIDSNTKKNKIVTVFTDFRHTMNLLSSQIANMVGDTGVILPDGMKHPDDWPDWQDDAATAFDEPPKPAASPKEPVVAITSPAEFEGDDEKIDVALTPVNPAPRHGSKTPIDEFVRDQLVKSVEEMAKAIKESLESYESEDSNRVHAAQQLAKAAKTIQNQAAAGGKRLLIPMFYRMVEATARAHHEDAHALEVIDREMFAGLIDMARQVYAFYPALAEANDPNNTHRVPDNPGVTSGELTDRLRDLFFGAETREHFTDKTRELFEAEINATTPEGTDAEKFRIARFGALAGEVVREMRHRAARAKSELPTRELTGKWIAASMTAEAIWKLVAPFLGL